MDSVHEILSDGARFLHSNGVEQWTGGYPSREIISGDIEKKGCYIAEIEGKPAAAFTLLPGPEEAYAITYGGEWLTEGTDYFVIHRIAVSADYRGRGIAGRLFDFCFEKAGLRGGLSVRIDTHRDNKIMQRTIEKGGFTPCGYVIYKDTGERLAYEKII